MTVCSDRDLENFMCRCKVPIMAPGYIDGGTIDAIVARLKAAETPLEKAKRIGENALIPWADLEAWRKVAGK